MAQWPIHAAMVKYSESRVKANIISTRYEAFRTIICLLSKTGGVLQNQMALENHSICAAV